MQTILLLLVMFVIYSLPAFLALLFSEEIQIPLYYVTLGIFFTLTQLFNTLYEIPLEGTDFTLNGGDISYSALLFTAVFLLLSQPDPKIVRNLIYVSLIMSVFLFILFYFLGYILGAMVATNILGVPLLFLEFSYVSMLFSFVLFSSEIFLLLFLIKKIIPHIKGKIWANLIISWIYVGILILDGIVYPIGINILFPGYSFSVLNGIVAKSIFGAGFGLNIFIFLMIFPSKKSEFIAIDTPFRLYLLPPGKKTLVTQLHSAKKEISTLRDILPICAQCKKIRDDAGFWSQVEDYMLVHQDLQFTHGICPECEKKALKELDELN
ncbi:MAG: hypothetical protein ACTSWW_01750 [Promethearchaeota archaeon]